MLNFKISIYVFISYLLKNLCSAQMRVVRSNASHSQFEKKSCINVTDSMKWWTIKHWKSLWSSKLGLVSIWLHCEIVFWSVISRSVNKIEITALTYKYLLNVVKSASGQSICRQLKMFNSLKKWAGWLTEELNRPFKIFLMTFNCMLAILMSHVTFNNAYVWFIKH